MPNSHRPIDASVPVRPSHFNYWSLVNNFHIIIMCVFIFHFFCVLFYDIGLHFHNNNNNNNNQLTELIWYRSISKRRKRHICKISHSSEFFSMDVTSWEVRSRGARRTQNKARFPSKRNARNARNATQSIALRKRKPQATQAFDWLLR